jgi:hypothetical protein
MPQDQFPPGDPFHNLEGKDGFHVTQTELGPVLMLSVLAYSGGVPCSLDGDPNNTSVEIVDHMNPTPKQRGECERLRLVMDSVCRYFTTGGTWEELAMALREARRIIRGGIAFPGYSLITSYSTTDGDYQHLFQKDGTNDAVLWNEPEIGDSGLPVGGWISATTLQKFREEQENDESIWGQKRARGGLVKVEAESGQGDGEEGVRHPLQLPDRQGDGASQTAEGSDLGGVH